MGDPPGDQLRYVLRRQLFQQTHPFRHPGEYYPTPEPGRCQPLSGNAGSPSVNSSRDHEKAGFIEGIKIGVGLATELK